MLPLELQHDEAALLRKVGQGTHIQWHEDESAQLFFTGFGGTGLLITGRVGTESLQMWVDESQWCQWIRPIISVNHWASVPGDLHTALLTWCCAALHQRLSAMAIAPLQLTEIHASDCALRRGWTVKLVRAEAQLDLHFLLPPLGWLEAINALMVPLPAATSPGTVTIPIALIAGWSEMALSTLSTLRCGDALRLHRVYAVEHGEWGLFTHRPLARVIETPQQQFECGDTMDAWEDWLDFSPAREDSSATSISTLPENTTVRVVAQAATLEIALSQLAALKTGDIVDCPVNQTGDLVLLVAGKPLGRGILLKIDDRYAVRIEHLY